MRERIFRPIVILAAGLVALGACSSTENPRFIRISGPAPEITGLTLTGGSVSPADYRGKVVVANFWNPFCAPCRREQPLLQSEWERLKGQGVFVVGLMYVGGNPPWPNDPDAARDWLREFGVTYPALVDGASRWAGAFGVQGIPTTVIVDRDGRMRFRILGELKPGRLDEALQELEGSP